jgi:hypothetical protein
MGRTRRFLLKGLKNAFFVYDDRCEQNFTDFGVASAEAKHGNAMILSRELGIVMARIELFRVGSTCFC